LSGLISCVASASAGKIAAAAVALATPAHEGLAILYHADLDGRLATPDCASRRSVPPDYPALLGAIAVARAAAAANQLTPPVTLLGGNLAAPDLFGRGLLARGAPGVELLATLFARGSYDAVALGHHDLSLDPSELQLLVDALASRGMPVLATNLRCDEHRRALCAATRREVVIPRGPSKVGVLATLSPTVLSGIASPSRAGLSLDEPLDVIRRTVRRLRAGGATHVILMVQGPRGARGLEEVDALQRRLASCAADRPAQNGAQEGSQDGSRDGSLDGSCDAPDVILAGGLQDEESDRALRLLRRDESPPVVGAPAGSIGLSKVELGGAPSAFAVDALFADQTVADASARALLIPEIASYCAAYERPIAKVAVQGGLTRDAFVVYALEVMRRRARCEIALLNRAAVKRAPFPITDTVKRAQLHGALPYHATIGVARITGAAVESMIGPALDNPKLAALGLTRSPAGLQVNGRPIDRARDYRIATIGFVASGGDGILPAGALPWRPLASETDLREAVEGFLSTGSGAEDGDATVNPATDFGRPASQRALVVGLTDLGLDVADTRIANNPGYGDAQLTRSAQRVLKGELTGLLQVRHPIHESDTRVNLKYAWTRTQAAGAAAVSGETTDLITFATTYNYRGLRSRVWGPRPAIPDPYLRVGIESEFTRPDLSPTQPRNFHHLELTNTAGVLFTLTGALKARGGAGVRKELLAPAPDRWRSLLEAGATLTPVALVTWGPLAVKLEGILDYNFVDPAGTREHQLRGNGKFSVPLLPRLFITAGLDLFAVERQRQGWAASYDTTVGLRVHLDAAHQGL
jgi:2',3'-cyclic-nucleotide 2'-phosphodiesterase (5'-nucleotidase family)